jgi:hypothetical protein
MMSQEKVSCVRSRCLGASDCGESAREERFVRGGGLCGQTVRERCAQWRVLSWCGSANSGQWRVRCDVD